MWGDGLQTRSFTYIDDCVEGIVRLTKSDFCEPVNLGSDEMVSMNEMQARPGCTGSHTTPFAWCTSILKDGLFPAHLSAKPPVSIPTRLDAFQLRF